MLTPGVAGALTLLMTNSLALAFGIPLDYLGYAALAISALFAALVIAGSIPLHQRIVYRVLNTLIIFCVAMGSNVTGGSHRSVSLCIGDALSEICESPRPRRTPATSGRGC